MRLVHDLRSAQIHRFRNRVSLYVRNGEGDGVTVYLSPRDARRISDTLATAAREIDVFNVPFAKSTVGTVEFEGEA